MFEVLIINYSNSNKDYNKIFLDYFKEHKNIKVSYKISNESMLYTENNSLVIAFVPNNKIFICIEKDGSGDVNLRLDTNTNKYKFFSYNTVNSFYNFSTYEDIIYFIIEKYNISINKISKYLSEFANVNNLHNSNDKEKFINNILKAGKNYSIIKKLIEFLDPTTYQYTFDNKNGICSLSIIDLSYSENKITIDLTSSTIDLLPNSENKSVIGLTAIPDDLLPKSITIKPIDLLPKSVSTSEQNTTTNISAAPNSKNKIKGPYCEIM